MYTSKVWYVTGASQGLGLTLVKKLLDDGYRVAATSRDVSSLKRAVGVTEMDSFLPLVVDLTDSESIRNSIRKTHEAFGQIDVVVNNAGYGMTGTLEETDDCEVRNIFNVNVLATLDVSKSVLPIMRRQRSGHIINIGSVAGFAGAPGWSVYSATKAAVAAFSEVLAEDVREFGIRVTVVEPSGFRTGFLGKGSLAITTSSIEGYEAVKKTQAQYLSSHGMQKGDPDQAVEILITLGEMSEPPRRLFLGSDAYTRASKKLRDMSVELETWKATTIGADYK